MLLIWLWTQHYNMLAVLMGGKDLMICFIPVQHILDGLIQTGVSDQNFRNSHYFLAI